MLHLLKDVSWEKEKQKQKKKNWTSDINAFFRVFGKSSDYSILSNISKDGIDFFPKIKFPFLI